MDWSNKYAKYKKKYINLKKLQKGGGVQNINSYWIFNTSYNPIRHLWNSNENIDPKLNKIVWNNDSCYMDAILMLILYRQNTRIANQIENEQNIPDNIDVLRNCNPKEINNLIKKMYYQLHGKIADPSCSMLRGKLHTCNPSSFPSQTSSGSEGITISLLDKMYDIGWLGTDIRDLNKFQNISKTTNKIIEIENKFFKFPDDALQLNLNNLINYQLIKNREHEPDFKPDSHRKNLFIYSLDINRGIRDDFDADPRVKIEGFDMNLFGMTYNPSRIHVACVFKKLIDGKERWFHYTFSSLNTIEKQVMDNTRIALEFIYTTRDAIEFCIKNQKQTTINFFFESQ